MRKVMQFTQRIDDRKYLHTMEEKKIVKRINEVSVDASFKVCKYLVN